MFNDEVDIYYINLWEFGVVYTLSVGAGDICCVVVLGAGGYRTYGARCGKCTNWLPGVV